LVEKGGKSEKKKLNSSMDPLNGCGSTTQTEETSMRKGVNAKTGLHSNVKWNRFWDWKYNPWKNKTEGIGFKRLAGWGLLAGLREEEVGDGEQ